MPATDGADATVNAWFFGRYIYVWCNGACMTYKTILYNFIFIGIKICTKYHSLTFCLTTSGTQKDFLSVRERAGRIFKVYILFFQSFFLKKKPVFKETSCIIYFLFYY